MVLAQTLTGLLFFASGLDREVLRIFAHSLATHPPGQFALTGSAADAMIHLSSTVFSTGLRLVLPLLALLLMMEISLALLARLNGQLQLLQLSFSAKMLASLGLLAWLVLVFPNAFRHTADELLPALGRIFSP